MKLKLWGLRLLQVFLIFVPLGIAAAFMGIQVSSQPAFCGTCHIMKPYYESWKTSSHKDIACVECHIPPGIGSELRKKYEALSMLAKYFTGTYGTNPWAEIPDQSCLRPGCHEQRLLVGREVFKGVLFDHRPHLTEMKREKKLRCTSCHSQIVQGQHIAVTESTCFLCHFKEAKLNEGTARCTTCHEIPGKQITTAGLSFDHADVKRFSMECTLCHGTVVKGTGEVPLQRCNSCHSETERLSKIKETEFLHRMHVTDHKIDCLNCHAEIQHKIPHELEAASTRCEACHVSSGHSPQKDLYVGIGGKGVTPQAAAMYLAGVSCESCHLVTKEGQKLPDEVSCMSCHGAKFVKIYQSWQETLRTRLEIAEAMLTQTKSLIAPSETIQRAAQNIAFVQNSKAIHNPGYASALLWQAYQDLQKALKEKSTEQALTLPWPQVPYQTRCTTCHLGIETQFRTTNQGLFRHEPHVVRRGLECTICHADVSDRDTQHGARRSDCTSCHPSQVQLEKADPQTCLQCHPSTLPARSERVKFPHDTHINFGLHCSICHANVNQLDHVDFLTSQKGIPPFEHNFCGTCHRGDVPPEGNNCTKCHVNF